MKKYVKVHNGYAVPEGSSHYVDKVGIFAECFLKFKNNVWLFKPVIFLHHPELPWSLVSNQDKFSSMAVELAEVEELPKKNYVKVHNGYEVPEGSSHHSETEGIYAECFLKFQNNTWFFKSVKNITGQSLNSQNWKISERQDTISSFAVELPELPKKNYVKVHNGHQVPEGSTHHSERKDGWAEFFLKFENNTWFYISVNSLTLMPLVSQKWQKSARKDTSKVAVELAEVEEVPKKNYVKVHNGHIVPEGSTHFIAERGNYLEGFLKFENNVWLFKSVLCIYTMPQQTDNWIEYSNQVMLSSVVVELEEVALKLEEVALKLEELPKKNYVKVHNGHQVPEGSTHYQEKSLGYEEGFVKFSDTHWYFARAGSPEGLIKMPITLSLPRAVELPEIKNPEEIVPTLKPKPNVGDSVTLVDPEFLNSSGGLQVYVDEKIELIVVASFIRPDQNTQLVTLMAKDPEKYKGFITINPDFLEPFISEKDKAKAKEYNRVYDELRGAIHTEDFSLETVAQYLAHNKLLK
jgi:hypothetical protein